ncbi:hypothetical protein KAFR_0A06880 [Kazachstania africana CBS 2517]|uniref:Mitochondrial glycine transporter n=1 Tax=Kazachstania africana (strain ATCC 22294 / BCRC 22015 / CBS 2517 / CECT 1963 / NBRC 1671 / NRRL Y-8276) TaxID=1071382 RepID=H2AP23_KAZAF|nr:hypothetical protein KAFR_0A06880 [Kazachstania africana CBS 2517]CCF56123.1 hypothetical protein KAFR_0A06880 [Kazachstania africana CBS 2517]
MPQNKSRSSSHLVGGFFGGLTSAVALQPFDLVKTRVQQEHVNGIRAVFKEFSSVKDLWRGTIPSALRTSVGSALYLSCLNTMRMYVSNQKQTVHVGKSSKLPELHMTENLVTGAIARGVVGYITMPITVIKVRYESTLYNYKSLIGATKDIFATNGINGFFKGYGTTCIRDAPYSGIYVLLYEKFKLFIPQNILPNSLKHYKKDLQYTSSTSTIINTMSAFTAACVATTITAPFDTIKTRMQLNPQRFTNFFASLSIMIKNESLLNLFDGLSLRLTRKAFSAGIAWSIYEEIIKKFI